MRRFVFGAAAGVLVALAAVTGVSAYWQAQERIDLASTSSGDLRIDAVWRDGAPTWSPLFPGDSTEDAVIRVTSHSAGTTLRWKLTVSNTVAPDVRDHIDFAAWRGACGTGTPITTAGISDLAPDATLDVCVRVTLSSDAPTSLQSKTIAPRITMVAEQVTS